MNARRVHKLMREQFPAFDAAAMDWVNVADTEGPRIDTLRSLLAKNVGSADVIVEVHRKMGAVLSLEEAASFVAAHIGEGEVKVANREFSGFVVVARSGVACGWQVK